MRKKTLIVDSLQQLDALESLVRLLIDYQNHNINQSLTDLKVWPLKQMTDFKKNSKFQETHFWLTNQLKTYLLKRNFQTEPTNIKLEDHNKIFQRFKRITLMTRLLTQILDWSEEKIKRTFQSLLDIVKLLRKAN